MKFHASRFRTMKSCTLVIILLLLPVVNAAIITDVDITDKILDDMIEEELTLRLVENTEGSFTLRLPEDSFDIVINGDPVSGSNVISVPLECSECLINAKYKINDIVRDLGSGDHVFTRTLNLPPTDFLNLTIVLPAGFVIFKKGDEPPIVPLPDRFETDGKNILIHWEESDPELPKSYVVYFSHVHEDGYGTGGMLILASLLVIVGGALGYFLYNRKPAVNAEEIPVCQIPSTIFVPDEQSILNVLKEYERELSTMKMVYKPITQKEIGKRLNWSKSKVSAILSGLEHKKVVQREKFGRNFRVEVAPDYKHKLISNNHNQAKTDHY